LLHGPFHPRNKTLDNKLSQEDLDRQNIAFSQLSPSFNLTTTALSITVLLSPNNSTPFAQ
jgi:hypothetical protein